MTQEQMAKIDSFLGDAGVFYLATADGDQPRLRPLGLHLHLDGKLLISVGDFKNVYRQMKANPRVELVALAKDFRWLRVAAEAVEEAAADSARYQELALQAEPGLRAVYNDQTGHRMAFFRLEKATALVYGLTGEPEELK